MADYVLVKDIPLFLKRGVGIRISPKLERELGALERGFASRLVKLINACGVSVRVLSSAEFIKGIKNLTSGSALPIISIDAVLGCGLGEVFQINNSITLSKEPYRRKPEPRFGCKPLEAQALELAKKYKGKSVALFDDDLWTGRSVLYCIRLFKKHKINVRRIYSCTATQKAIGSLSAKGIAVFPLFKRPVLSLDETRNFLCDGRAISKTHLHPPLNSYAGRLFSPVWDSLRNEPYFKVNQPDIRALSEEYISKLNELLKKHRKRTKVKKLGVQNSYTVYCIERSHP